MTEEQRKELAALVERLFLVAASEYKKNPDVVLRNVPEFKQLDEDLKKLCPKYMCTQEFCSAAVKYANDIGVK